MNPRSLPLSPSLRRGGLRSSATLSAAEARRVVLAAQGFAQPRPPAPTRQQLLATIRRLGLLQIDSVNILVRSHYLPLFSRLGGYPATALDAMAFSPPSGNRRRPRPLFEYWGHEASLLPVETYPLLRWRMERAARSDGIYGSLASLLRRRPALVSDVLAEVAANGPLRASELERRLNPDSPAARSSPWWGWSDTKRALEFLFWSGQVTAAARTSSFERLYDLPERVFPPEILAAPAPPEEEAQRALVEIAARALGVATERDLRDYFRLDPADSKQRVAELVEAGRLLPVAVEGWTAPAFLDPAARFPRRAVEARALLSPFDSLVWERARTERLFGFRYRLEIYTPAPKRVFGYYVLPFLLGERIVGRVDLKADRAAGTLRVLAAHAEPDLPQPGDVAPALRLELQALAAWLGLPAVDLRAHGRRIWRWRCAKLGRSEDGVAAFPG